MNEYLKVLLNAMYSIHKENEMIIHLLSSTLLDREKMDAIAEWEKSMDEAWATLNKEIDK